MTSKKNVRNLQQRGQLKRQEFVNKLQNIFVQEEKGRIPISRGLSWSPWTANEPQVIATWLLFTYAECHHNIKHAPSLIVLTYIFQAFVPVICQFHLNLFLPVQILPKRTVRGRITKPLDIKLHTQTRAIERAKFNQLVSFWSCTKLFLMLYLVAFCNLKFEILLSMTFEEFQCFLAFRLPMLLAIYKRPYFSFLLIIVYDMIDHLHCQWQMLVQIQMALNFLSRL